MYLDMYFYVFLHVYIYLYIIVGKKEHLINIRFFNDIFYPYSKQETKLK